MTGRRGALMLLLGGGAALAGCGNRAAADQALASPGAKRTMIVHRDPSCGCCSKWAELAGAAGYRVSVVDEDDMAALKRRLGVPAALASCHTAEVAGVVVEGHVPFQALARFLTERPSGAIGLAVPGMPVGSPGMEMPGVAPDPLVVHAFAADGSSRVYAGPGEAPGAV
jgi:hypothetical protein